MVIHIPTRDRVIWNKEKIFVEIAKVMSAGIPFTIDLLKEGPDARDLGLFSVLELFAEKFNFDMKKITLKTCNIVEHHSQIQIKSNWSKHLLNRELKKEYNINQSKNNDLLHFGRFIGRSNSPRLFLSQYLHHCYPNETISTYHYKYNDDYHKDDVGLERLSIEFNIKDLTPYAEFLNLCPITLNSIDFTFQKDNNELDFSSQLHQIEKNSFINLYKKFFVEIVSETYYNGNTFFLTEKTFRPILLKTPFIIQGPQWFLKRLKQLGFKTFDRWWDEGYDEDSPNWSIHEIVKVIDFIAQKSTAELYQMYKEMQPILLHNQKLLFNLTDQDFEKIKL